MPKFHNPQTIADPIGTYSHGVETPPNARWLHIAGQIGIRKDGSVPPTVEGQTEAVWQNIVAILAAAGMKITDLVKITSYLTSLASFPAYAAGRAKFLAGHRPASTSLVIGSLVKPEYLVEVEAIAAQAAPAPKTREACVAQGAQARCGQAEEEAGRVMQRILRVAIALGFALALDAAAQGYPAKPIRLIVPFPPGGSADILARAIGQKAGEGLGQTLVVENRPGAGTAIGAEALARSAPDGYAVMIGTVSSHAINPALNPKLPFDPVKDFTAVSLVATIPFAMIVHPSVQAKNVQEFVALARAKPGSLNYSSAGNGTSNHLAGELFKSMAGIDIVHIPYKGSAPALNDLVAGQVALMFDLVLTAAPHVKSGAARGLAVTGAQRSSVLPELPTVAESGLPGYEVSAWFGIFAPAGVPEPVVQRLNAEFVKALRDSDLRQRLASQGAEPLTSTPAEFAAYLRSEIDKWGKVVKAAGMKVD